MHVAIVGSGLTGLATSALLARQGHQVTLLEALNHVGGLARPISLGEHEFCPGPQYLWGFGPRSPGERIMKALGLALPMRSIRRDFVQAAIGEGPLVDLIDGVPVSGPTSENVRDFIAVLDRLGRVSETIAVDARFCASRDQMLWAVARARKLTFKDKSSLFRYRNDSVADVAQRFDVNPTELRLLASSQLIFAERLDELSAVVFASARHMARSVAIPQGGIASFMRAIICAVRDAAVTIRTNSSVLSVARVGRQFRIQTRGEFLTVDKVVWCCSPGVVRHFVPSIGPVFRPSHSVGCLCILAELSDRVVESLRERTLCWFADQSDVSFAPVASSEVDAIKLMSPTVLAGQTTKTHILCVYHPLRSGSRAMTEVLRAAVRLVERTGSLRVLTSLPLGAESWNSMFGAWAGSVYGRRLTAASLQTSVVGHLPEGMSLAHSGAGIPGVLGCLQMAEAVAQSV